MLKNPLEFGSILVTGGSGGVGRALVRNFTAAGFSVWNWDKNPPATIEPGESFVSTDLVSADRVRKECESFVENFVPSEKGRRLIGFVHCAGYGGPYHKITEVTLEEWDAVFSINLRSAFQITQALLPVLSAQKFGRLIYIASSLSVKGSALSVAYSASKHGLVGFVKSIAAEWGEFGITANAISPGYIETKMGIQEDQVDDHRKKILSMTPTKTIADPEEIARVASFLLSNDSHYINGANWAVDGGITAI
ncbi:oxidoreductase, short chain dehydrogenase/reductase family protein [Leptospira inadai serovar Lyme str. 10]|uniref:Oxidoreductase, short chain dehydrogenase/reductase family protein n=2 Tax=Leptospira inadai serovar Lyme TaxID=293084 RepID=V6H9R8_9LEPT|nr:SDR family oxidoreductase [Leptospira inadai]EQA35976.1 oxidoreductase, short chain dehydrogenase/reductase family protein [Leptospira inadai serovar Lyme str. 10]PNV76941.1 3-ketoacyl-ACP reductase [Leptospira inadai serovar Lyme]